MLVKGLDKCLQVLLISLLVAMTVVVTSQILMRYVMNSPLPWGEELTRYLFMYLVFLGSAWGIRYSVHVSIDSVVRMLPDHLEKIANLVARLLIGLFLAALLYYGAVLSLENMSQKSPALGLPIGLVYAAIPVGAIIGIIFVFAPKKELKETVAV